MVCFPDNKEVAKDTMNYTIVINAGTWILSMAYYFAYKHKTYVGPRSNLDDEDVITGTEVAQYTSQDALLPSKLID